MMGSRREMMGSRREMMGVVLALLACKYLVSTLVDMCNIILLEEWGDVLDLTNGFTDMFV